MKPCTPSSARRLASTTVGIVRHNNQGSCRLRRYQFYGILPPRDAYNSPRRQQPNAATQRRYHNICFSNLQPYISDSFILVRK
ncbi:uncharacterized protein [Lolium perenne]|uniref:uncharacterized protein isoform X5 n=1 Tax=Lolium perenne TaxID=4522 RepID=UPI003A9904C5